MQLGGIGDSLILTSVLSTLKEAFPAATFDLGFSHGYVKEAMEGHPCFRKVMEMEYFPKGYRHFGRIGGKADGVLKALSFFPRLALRVALGRYDVAILLPLSEQMENLGGAITFACRIPLRIGLGKNHHGYLHHQVDADFHARHRMDLYREVLQFLGVPRGTGTRDAYVFPICEDEKQWAASALDSALPGGFRRPLVALHPGGADLVVPRRWPTDRFGEIGKWFMGRNAGTVLLTGGPDDTQLCDEVEKTIGGSIINLCGLCSVKQTAAVLAHCDFCITNDTAALHLSAAMGVPHILALFGPVDPKLVVPRGHDIRWVQADLPCVPCVGSVINNSTGPCRRRVKGECLQSIDTNDVIRILEGMLEEYDSREDDSPDRARTK